MNGWGQLHRKVVLSIRQLKCLPWAEDLAFKIFLKIEFLYFTRKTTKFQSLTPGYYDFNK